MSSKYLRPAVALAALALAMSSGLADEAGFRAQGNEPFWSLRKTADAITFQPMEGEAVTVTPVPDATEGDGAVVFETTLDGSGFRLEIADRLCVDTMSGMSFPNAVTVKVDEVVYAGCGGEPASLLAGDWAVVAVDGADLVADTVPTISFDVDGRAVSGSASCNRYFGGFALTGEGLSFGELGASMMMCGEAVMAQEQALLDILESVTGFTIADDGSLTLTTGDDRSLSAERAG